MNPTHRILLALLVVLSPTSPYAQHTNGNSLIGPWLEPFAMPYLLTGLAVLSLLAAMVLHRWALDAASHPVSIACYLCALAGGFALLTAAFSRGTP